MVIRAIHADDSPYFVTAGSVGVPRRTALCDVMCMCVRVRLSLFLPLHRVCCVCSALKCTRGALQLSSRVKIFIYLYDVASNGGMTGIVPDSFRRSDNPQTAGLDPLKDPPAAMLMDVKAGVRPSPQ